MKPWVRWMYLVAGVAAVLVVVSVAAQAIRQGSWDPPRWRPIWRQIEVAGVPGGMLGTDR